MGLPPNWVVLGNGFKSQAQRLHDQLQQIQLPDGSNDRQAVGTLHRSSLQEAALLKPAEERVKDAPLGLMGDEPLTELAEDAGIEAWVSQWQM